MGRVVHFELFSEEPQRQVEFYRSLFGWDMQAWEGQAEYHLVTTGPQTEVGIDGAIAPRGAAGDQGVVLTIDVPDVDSIIECATGAGAAVVQEKNAVPGVGWFAYLRDPAGTVFGVMQADPAAGIPAGAPVGSAAGAEGAAAWDDVGDRLRDLGASLARAVSDSASSPQAQRVREEADRAAGAVREAGKQAADKARPHVVAALDRVSRELDELAARLRGSAGVPEEPPAPTGPGDEDGTMPSPEEQRPLA